MNRPHSHRLAWVLAFVAAVVAAAAEPDPLARAERAARSGDLDAAFTALESLEAVDFASRVLTSDDLRALTRDPSWRVRLRELVQDRARDSVLAMTAPGEPGEPLGATITIVDRRSGAPVVGARVDLVQVDATGRYWPQGEEGDFNPRLFGTAITDDDGVIRVQTIRPAHYAKEYGSEEPAHIHFSVWVEGGLRRAAEFWLDDDPRVTDELRQSIKDDPLPIAKVEKNESGEWQATVTIPIGRISRPDPVAASP